MKHARKLTSLLLALVMVFALAVTVAADGTTGTTGTGSITVDNPIPNTTYTAYKIFDVVYDGAKKNYSYTIKGTSEGTSEDTSEWFDTVKAYADVSKNGLKLTQVSGTNTYVVTTTDAFSAPPFAEALKAAVNGKTGITLKVADGKATATGLDLGYYFVKSSANDALCNLTTTNPTVTIHDKNDMPFEKKDDKVSAEVGETVNYVVTGKVPDYTGFKKYTYLITDTMSEGLTFQKDVKVTVGGTNVTSACTISYDESNANKFTVSIPVKSHTIGDKIEVTYSALVNENAVAKISKNSATLTYSNNPKDGTEATTTPVEETVYSSKIAIEKVEKLAADATATPKKLKDAEFVLYKKVPTDADPDAIQYYKKWDDTDTTKTVSWVNTIAEATTVKTDENGKASFEGLANGTYYLVETKAPAGYNQLTEAQKVEVHDGEHNTPVTSETQLIVTATVENQAGTLLPSTGGMGTTVFYVLGAVLVVGAGVLLVTKKRMSQSEI